MNNTRQIKRALAFIREAQAGLNVLGANTGHQIEKLELAIMELESHPIWGLSKDNLDAFRKKLVEREGDHERRRVAAAIAYASSEGNDDNAKLMFRLETDMCKEYGFMLEELESFGFSEAILVGERK